MTPCTALCQTLNQTLPAFRGGTYIVVLWLHTTRETTVGRLGHLRFPRGYYCYVGSAKGGLAARLHRHIHGATTRHWHLDYLRPQARVLAWRAFADNHYPECVLAQDLRRLGDVICHRFGASDCSCPTHLLYYPHRAHVVQALQHTVRTASLIQQPMDWYGGTRAGVSLVRPSEDHEDGHG